LGSRKGAVVKKMALKRLTLCRETLRHLSDAQSKEAKGGSDRVEANWTTGDQDSHPACCV
jgi:hypothetical protein